jgi:hypothetical protein
MKITRTKNGRDIVLEGTGCPNEFVLSAMRLTNNLSIARIITFNDPPIDGSVFPEDGYSVHVCFYVDGNPIWATIIDNDNENIFTTVEEFLAFKNASID